MQSIKDKIHRLEQTRMTETEIVQTLKISHLAYRKHCHRVPAEVLSASCKEEIKHTELTEEHTLVEIARLYRTSYSQVHMALYQKFAKRPEVSADAILAHLLKTDNTERTRKYFSLGKEQFSRYLKEIGWLDERAMDLQKIANFIEDNPDMTYEDIAKYYGTSKSFIAKVARDHGVVRQEQNKHDWAEVLQHAQDYSIAAAASHYNVSRTAIYYHRNKKCAS